MSPQLQTIGRTGECRSQQNIPLSMGNLNSCWTLFVPSLGGIAQMLNLPLSQIPALVGRQVAVQDGKYFRGAVILMPEYYLRQHVCQSDLDSALMDKGQNETKPLSIWMGLPYPMNLCYFVYR